MSFPLTQEQQDIVTLAKTGADLAVIAGAGTGKTSTLLAIANALPGKGLYIAFNKAIQVEASEKFAGTTVECRTAHSLAFPILFKHNLKHRLNAPRPKFAVAQATIGIPSNGFYGLTAGQVLSLVNKTVLRYCRTADRDLTSEHVPFIQGFDSDTFRDLKGVITPLARKAWNDIQDAKGVLKFEHDHYLKLWALSNPDLSRKFDYILYDEAQDADGCIAGVVLPQRCQKILVGDSAQAIYAFRGTVDVLGAIATKLPLSQSFRFGSAIAAEARKFLSALGSDLDLKGFDKITDTVGSLDLANADAVLCRTNAEVVKQAFEALEAGLKVYIEGDALTQTIRFAEGLAELDSKGTTSHPDLIAFHSVGEFLRFLEDNDDAGDLRTRHSLVERFGIDGLIDIASRVLKASKDADVTISTAHKAKGLEWDAVKIGPDFKAPEEGREPSAEVLRLAYVAVTRAKTALDIGSLAFINDFC
jgi:superfamily I DNA/RNA helicase